MSAPPSVTRLVNAFRANAEYYLSDAYSEALVRQEFINPLFEALGWDVSNRALSPPQDRDVMHEGSLRVEGSLKAPDYSFRTDRRRRFFVEAKKPHVHVASGRPAAYQVRRYGWSAGLPFSIVTDFEEFAVYDCRDVPDPRDQADIARLRYFTYEEYDTAWDWIERYFSRSAVAGGSLEELASERSPRPTQTLGPAFLTDIETWRSELAADLAERNNLQASQINSAIQQLIDRIVFLRIAESRGLEPPNQLERVRGDGQRIYPRLLSVFRRADDRYNSGLFHFRSERDRTTPPDYLADKLVVGDAVLNRLLGRLYFPEPYEFSFFPADILGQVYERFLGQVVTLDEDGRAKVELKPEVRKSGGIYYTPQYVVEYIVKSTLEPILRGRTPGQVAGLRILDPACGSGSFLIAAYQHLMDWHMQYYLAGTRRERHFVEQTPDGVPRLKTEERRRILLNNIWGVDIDHQAVEVAKMSLLLKLIEGQQQTELELGRLLPDLDANVVRGNSLISSDFQSYAIDRELVQPLDWAAAFPKIMHEGGFDAIIGNPPYFSVDATWGRGDPRAAYLASHFSEVYTDKTDVLFYFLAKAAELGKNEIAFIVSRSLLEAFKARRLRGLLASQLRVREVVDFQHALVFPRVGINTAILRLTKARRVGPAQFRRFKPRSVPPALEGTGIEENPQFFDTLSVSQGDFGEDSWTPAGKTTADVLAKIDAGGEAVAGVLHVGQGMQTGRNNVFQGLPWDELNAVAEHRRFFFRRARNSDIQRYHIGSGGPALIYPEGARHFSQLPALIRTHLTRLRAELESRAAFARGNCEWWRYTWPLHKEYARRSRIFTPYMAETNRFALDASASFLGITDTTVLYDKDQPEDMRYVTGVLNSKALTFRFRFIGKLKGGGVYEYFDNTVGRLPIPRRQPGDEDHDAIVALVTRRMALAQELLSAVPTEAPEVMDECAQTEAEIDGIVYRVFGLDETDVRVIEDVLSARPDPPAVEGAAPN